MKNLLSVENVQSDLPPLWGKAQSAGLNHVSFL